jgi:hypothetical protein
MNTIANHLNSQLIAARGCDALEPCADCQSKRTQYAAIRHAERVAALTLTSEAPRVPAQRIGSLRERLLTA